MVLAGLIKKIQKSEAEIKNPSPSFSLSIYLSLNSNLFPRHFSLHFRSLGFELPLSLESEISIPEVEEEGLSVNLRLVPSPSLLLSPFFDF